MSNVHIGSVGSEWYTPNGRSTNQCWNVSPLIGDGKACNRGVSNHCVPGAVGVLNGDEGENGRPVGSTIGGDSGFALLDFVEPPSRRACTVAIAPAGRADSSDAAGCASPAGKAPIVNSLHPVAATANMATTPRLPTTPNAERTAAPRRGASG